MIKFILLSLMIVGCTNGKSVVIDEMFGKPFEPSQAVLDRLAKPDDYVDCDEEKGKLVLEDFSQRVLDPVITMDGDTFLEMPQYVNKFDPKYDDCELKVPDVKPPDIVQILTRRPRLSNKK